jgi:hypothetical protein
MDRRYQSIQQFHHLTLQAFGINPQRLTGNTAAKTTTTTTAAAAK